MEQVQPTRTNLLVKRAQIDLAQQGAELLGRKKDALLQEFFVRVGETYRLRMQLAERIHAETTAAVVAEAVEGRQAIESAAAAANTDFQLNVLERNFWGVKVLELEHTFRPRDVLTRPYSPRRADLSVDEVADGFEHLVLVMLELAPRELWLKNVGEEIKKTNRKINALEQQLIPRLRAQAQAIAQALEERARDDRFRLKRLKKKKENAAREVARHRTG